MRFVSDMLCCYGLKAARHALKSSLERVLSRDPCAQLVRHSVHLTSIGAQQIMFRLRAICKIGSEHNSYCTVRQMQVHMRDTDGVSG